MSGSIRFAGDLPPFLVFAVALAAAGAVVWFYLRESRTVATPYSYLLPSLRASAVALAILILAGPVWHRRQTVGTLGRVVFAVDHSESMTLTDSSDESTPNRLDRALRLLTGDDQQKGWLESLSRTHEVDVVGFSSGEPTLLWSSGEQEGVPSVFDLAADGNRTDLVSGMTTSLEASTLIHVDQTPDAVGRAALVLMTDGRDNAGDSPLDVAKQLESIGVRVHSIGMGSEDEPTDIGIANVIRPESVASDGELVGDIVLKQYGVAQQESPTSDATKVMVRIESRGTVVWQQTVDTNQGTLQSVPFQLDVASIVSRIRGESPRGVRRSTVVMDLRAVVDPIDGDTNAENNSMPFRVSASTRDRRLLVLDGSSRWETRYIRNLFDRDPAWSVDSVLYGLGTDMLYVRRGEERGKFPSTLEAMAAYDAIVLGEIPPDQVTVVDADLLREFVTRGGGLIIVDGRYDRLRKLGRELLSDLIPVEYLDEIPMAVRSIRPNRFGFDHPVLNLWGEKNELAEFWEFLPAPPSALRVRAREGAEVWADAVGNDGRESPWLVTRLFGAGRVFYLSTDQTWRWRYRVADRFHARFWNQLLHAVMQPPYTASDDYVALGTDKIEYEVGDSAAVRVRLQDTSGQPVGDATVDALLTVDGRVLATVPLTIDDPTRGTYRAQTPPLQSGAYEIRIQASGFDANALQATAPIWVGTKDTVELGRVSLDAQGLTQITDAGAGMYVHESSADTLLDALKPLSSGAVVESDTLVWQSFYWFWAIMALLATEWLMRKRVGLV